MFAGNATRLCMGDGNWTEPNVLECESLQFLRIRLEVFCLCCSIVIAYQMFQACCYLEVLLFSSYFFLSLSTTPSITLSIPHPSFPPPILISHTSHLHLPSISCSLPPFHTFSSKHSCAIITLLHPLYLCVTLLQLCPTGSRCILW